MVLDGWSDLQLEAFIDTSAEMALQASAARNYVLASHARRARNAALEVLVSRQADRERNTARQLSLVPRGAYEDGLGGSLRV